MQAFFVVVCIFSTLYLLATVWLCLASRVVARTWCCVGFSRDLVCVRMLMLRRTECMTIEYLQVFKSFTFFFPRYTFENGDQLISEVYEYIVSHFKSGVIGLCSRNCGFELHLQV